jgi:hypothetical protein
VTVTIIGQLLDPVGHSWHGHRVDTAELRNRQADDGPIPLTLDHDTTVGEVLTLTRSQGSVYLVAVGDCDPLLDLTEPIYLSPTTDTRASDGGDGIILDVALTLETARVAARPCELIAGDVRRSSDRSRWALDGLTAELATRAADELSCRPAGAPIHIRDLEQQKWMERENVRARSSWQPSSLRPVRGVQVPPQMRPGWQPGDIEWSTARGRVLAIR